VWSGSADDLIDWARLEEAERYRSVSYMLRIPSTPEFEPVIRRFVCACCRSLQDCLPDDSIRQALDDIEAFAHSRGSYEKFVEARNTATIVIRQLSKRRQWLTKSFHVCSAVRDSAVRDVSLYRCITHFQDARLPVLRQAELFHVVAKQWVMERCPNVDLSTH